MLQAFIVRPFGTKEGVDFEKVDTELIQPALKAAGIAGSTTAAIIEQGNIREDMFSMLLTADLVVADLSIHNANVFYELGIRHALRDKRTFLIRCSVDEIPFDLKTDRYLSYNADNPGASLNALTNGLKATVLSDRQDSPVFYMLPKLEAQDPERLLAVPFEYAGEVDIAIAGRQTGRLSLLGIEADGFPWEIPALRLVGASQFKLRLFEDARLTWEKIRTRYPGDLEANNLLATIYQRLAELEISRQPDLGFELLQQSDEAIARLLNSYSRLKKNERAEIYSLKGRNEKFRWIEIWKKAAEAVRREKALQSASLKKAFEDYERGYFEDLNHFYSGVNALGLLTVMVTLAESLPATWEIDYDSPEDATFALAKFKEKQQRLATVVTVSLQAEKDRVEREGKADPWLSITEADLACLTSKKPQRVSGLYQKVIQDANELNFDAAKRQLQLYEQLNVLPENVKAALSAFSEVKAPEVAEKRHFLLFTGHMIDQPGRETPRFPQEKEAVARAAIRDWVEKEKKKIDTNIIGIAGGACGGDILFHEVCAELNIPTELYLVLPREQFVVESVQFGGTDWIDRFNALYKSLPRRGLMQTKEMPGWLQKKPGYSIWERNNLWMLQSSLVAGGMQMTLIALWDGEEGDGPGGTKHMLDLATTRGAKTIVINTRKLFGLDAR